jgi:hypothetical protein
MFPQFSGPRDPHASVTRVTAVTRVTPVTHVTGVIDDGRAVTGLGQGCDALLAVPR